MRDLIGLRARLLLLLLPECDEVIEERKHAGFVFTIVSVIVSRFPPIVPFRPFSS